MKRLLTILLAAMLVLGGAAGCGADNYPTEAGAEVVRIFTRDFEDWNNAQFSARVRKFNENMTDGIQVRVEFILEDSFNDKLTAARDAGNAPDIYIAAYNHIYNDKKKGYIAALDGLMPEEAFDDISENVLPALRFDGEHYAYPYFVEPSTMLFYRKSMLAKAGVAAPKTWDDLLKACAKLKPVLRPGSYALGMPWGKDLGWATWGITYNVLDGFPVNDNWDAARLLDKNAEYKDYLNFYKQLYDNDYAPAQALTARGYGEIINALCEDKLAMTVAGSWSLGAIQNVYSDVADDIGLVPMPTKDGDASKVSATNGGWAFVIDKNTPRKQQAADFLNWFLAGGAEETAEFFKLSNYSRFPARKSVASYMDALEADNAVYNTIKQVSAAAVLEPLYPWDISLKMQDTMDKMQLGLDTGETVDTVIRKVHNDINAIIKRDGLAGTNPASAARS